MSAPQTASEVAHHLLELSRELDKQTRALAELDRIAVGRRGTYEMVFARAFLDAEGSVDARKQTTRIACQDVWLDAELADAEVRAAKSAIRALETRIDVGRSYGTALRSEIALGSMGDTP